MKRDEILNMPAGQEMDKLIRRLFGAKAGWFPLDWSPSTDIAAAWQVVEKFSENPALANDVDIITTIRGWKCTIRTNKLDINANAEAAPLAICRAALLAVMELE